MKKQIIKILLCSVIILTFLCSCSLSKAETYPKPTEQFFVNDFANVIDEADEKEIYSRSVTLNEKTTAQVVVITVDDLNGEEPSDYALNIGREWGVGDKDKDNGIVILLSKDDRQIYIAVGEGLEGALPDSKTGRIIDRYGIDYFKKDNFSAGLLQISKAVVNEIYIENGLEPEENYTPINSINDTSNDNEETSYGSKVAISWAILVILIVLYSIFFGRRRRGFFWFGGPGGFGGGGFHGGSGGFGGGGFGGFSGGGGSFGGGGAGRGF